LNYKNTRIEMSFTTNKNTMRTQNYSIAILLLGWILCAGFLLSCEKEDVNPVYSSTTLKSNSSAHTASSARWRPCIPSTAYQLLDPAFNPKPTGYTETGQVVVSAAMDSIQVEIPVTAYWSVVSVQYKVATTEGLLSSTGWTTKTFTPAATTPIVRIPNPMGSSVAMQLNVLCQKQNLMGNVVYTCTMSPVTHVRPDGSRYIQYALPQACCPESYSSPTPSTN
jgi:hypothetical protein